MSSNNLQFSPDYTPDELRAMNVYKEVYGPKQGIDKNKAWNMAAKTASVRWEKVLRSLSKEKAENLLRTMASEIKGHHRNTPTKSQHLLLEAIYKPKITNLEEAIVRLKESMRDQNQSIQKLKNSQVSVPIKNRLYKTKSKFKPTYAATANIDSEKLIPIEHGGTAQFLKAFLAKKKRGYPLEGEARQGIQVHRLDNSVVGSELFGRTTYYANRAAGRTFATPAKLNGYVKAKHIINANNGYESAVVNPEHIVNPKITELPYDREKTIYFPENLKSLVGSTKPIQLNKQATFSPDYTPEQLKEMGVYGEVYGSKTAPRLASLPEWPQHWYNEADPHGWLQWYNRYSKGRRIDDDERQIKRWLAFKARHGGKMFQERPTPRRAYALRNWAVDPLKLVNYPQKRVELQKAMEEYRAKKYKQAADMEWARQSGGIPEIGRAFDFVKDKVVPGVQQAAYNFGGKAYDAVSNFLKPNQPAAPGAVANAFKPNWAKPQGPKIGIGIPTKTFTGLSSKISNALELYKRAVELKTSVPGETPEQLASRLALGNINKQQFFQNAKEHKWNIPGVPFANTLVQKTLPKIEQNPQPYLDSLKKLPKGRVVDVISKNPDAFKMVNNNNAVQPKVAGDKPGLWDNIRAKRARGETPAKPGDKNYPDKKQWKRLTTKKAELINLLEKLAEVRFDFKRKAPIGKRMARQMRSDRLGLAFLFGAGIGGVSGLSDAALTRYQLEGQKKRSKSDKVKKEIDKELEQISLPKSTLVGAAVGAGLGGYMQGDNLRASKRAKNFSRDFGRNFRHGFNDYFKRRRYQQGSFARESSVDSTNKAKKYFNIEKVKTKDEAKKVYRDLVRQHHPDKGGEEHKMKEINNHWDHIKHSDWFKKLAFEKAAAMGRSIYSAPKHVRDAFFRDPALHKRLSQAGGKASKTKKKINVEPKKTQLNFDDKLNAVPHEEGLELFREGKSRIKRADIIKFAKSKVLLDLIKAKELSDKKDFVHKNELLRKLVTEHPKQFKIDSHLNSSYVGLTHKPTGFKIHAQKKIIPSELLTDQ
jgi:hypothetical protein